MAYTMEELQEKARELADMVGNEIVDGYLPFELLEMTADALKEDYRQIVQAEECIREEQKEIEKLRQEAERGVSMAGSRTEKYTVIYRNTKRCEFHNIGQYIIATSVIGGTTFCAFFDTGIHTEESIKRRGSIKLHSIYSKK